MELTQKKTWIQLLLIVLLFFMVRFLESWFINEFLISFSYEGVSFVVIPIRYVLLIGGGVLITRDRSFLFERITWKQLLYSIGLMIFLWFAATSVNTIGKMIYPNLFGSVRLLAHGSEFYWVLPVLVAPIVEEIFFRGILFQQLEKVFIKTSVAVILGGLLFGLIHSSFQQAMFNVIMGIGYCYVYWRTRNIGITIFGHFLQNAVFHFWNG